MTEFATQELIIPEGPYEGQKFRLDTQPFARLLLEEVDSKRWQKIRVTGCVQSGKTLLAFVLPCIYHLFEVGEAVIAGVPSINMAGDKWRKEIWPVVRANRRFQKQMLQRGKGSKGGSFELMEFDNGAMLKFMGGHGGDEVRSGFTSRVLVVTEADRVDAAGEASREAAPIYQMEARTASEAENAVLWAECTTTTEDGFIWQEWQGSTASRIMSPCPHCSEHVCPEREHFVGWEHAENIIEAEENGTFICPNCSAIITDSERRTMNLNSKLVHKGQTIDRDGKIHGPLPPTRTLGFRYNAFNNLFWSSLFLARVEWHAARAKDYHSAQLQLRQWYWCLPALPDFTADVPLTAEAVEQREQATLLRGQLPAGTKHISVGADLRLSQLHFVAVAWLEDGRGHVCDLGTLPVRSKELGERQAVRDALEQLHVKLTAGWNDPEGTVLVPGWVWVDAGWNTDIVRHFARTRLAEGNRHYLPSFGRGQSLPGTPGGFTMPTKLSSAKPHIGEQYYVTWHSKHLLHAIVWNADHWKSRVHQGFATPSDQAGALTLFTPQTTADNNDVRVFLRHIVSEKCITKLVPGKGPVKQWINENRLANHYLDALAQACAAGHLCGVRVGEPQPNVILPQQRTRLRSTPTADETPYLLTDRED